MGHGHNWIFHTCLLNMSFDSGDGGTDEGRQTDGSPLPSLRAGDENHGLRSAAGVLPQSDLGIHGCCLWCHGWMHRSVSLLAVVFIQFLGCVTDVVGATFGEQHVVFSCLYSSLLLMVLHTFAWRLTSLNRVAGSCAYTGSLWSMLLASWSTVLMVKLFLAISIHALVYGESPCWKVLNSVPRGSF